MKRGRIQTLLLLLVLLRFAVEVVSALEITDDFSRGTQAWTPGPGWSVINPTPSRYFYRCDYGGDSLTWRKSVPFGSSWRFSAEVKFRTLYGNGGTTGVSSLGLSRDGINPSVKFLATVTHHSSGSVLIQAQYLGSDAVWYTVLDSGWRSGSAPEYVVRLERDEGSTRLRFRVQSTNGFSYTALTTSIPSDLLMEISVPGFRVNSAVVDTANVQLASATAPSPQRRNFHSLATNAINDLLTHFWEGNEATGQIVNTWNGYTNRPLPDPRGGLWERGMLYLTLENFWRLHTNGSVRQRLEADWIRTKNVYTTNELEACGADSGTNWAVDDAGWSALMYLAAYRATGDEDAQDRAKGLINCAFNRWLDAQLGGGMWYRDARDIKSLYQVAILLSSFEVFELTGVRSFFDRALSCYEWIEARLLRPDGLYWVDYGPSGPIGQERPDDINEAGSVVSLGGAMAMGVLHARLYRLTRSNDVYRTRAIRTAEALSSKLLSLGGIYVNDRDAWTQGTFAGDWAREVLSLPGVPAKHWTVLRATADSIYTYARTTNGYYGGSWSGPAEGPRSRWWSNGSKPEQIMTSSSSANMIVTAAILNTYEIFRPALEISRAAAGNDLQIKVSGEGSWTYDLFSSSNFANWAFVRSVFIDPFKGSSIVTLPVAGPSGFYRATLSLAPDSGF